MLFNIYGDSTTKTVSTQDWLRATKDMTISAYDPVALKSAPFSDKPAAEDDDQEPILGTHLRETMETVKERSGRK